MVFCFKYRKTSVFRNQIFKVIGNVTFKNSQRGYPLLFAAKRNTRKRPLSPGVLLWNALFARKPKKRKTRKSLGFIDVKNDVKNQFFGTRILSRILGQIAFRAVFDFFVGFWMRHFPSIRDCAAWRRPKIGNREEILAQSIPTFQLWHLVTTSLDRLEIQCDGRCVQTCEGHSTSEARLILLAIPGSRLRVSGTHSRSKRECSAWAADTNGHADLLSPVNI